MIRKNTENIILENENISYEVRFYCDVCDIEIAEDDQANHKGDCENDHS